MSKSKTRSAEEFIEALDELIHLRVTEAMHGEQCVDEVSLKKFLVDYLVKSAGRIQKS